MECSHGYSQRIHDGILEEGDPQQRIRQIGTSLLELLTA
jgi:hypothetical protein